MRNPEGGCSCSGAPWALLAMASYLLLLLLSSFHTVDSESDGRGFEWQNLTKRNFSSQIRLHPHILLMVTVPWSGESRSLMKELAHVVNYKQEKFGTLKLMLVYKNSEKILADAVGATEGITILYYHHSVSYKYQGRLRAPNILSSVYSFMSLLPEELPLKPLNTPEDLKTFLESTDKALLLLEFCGWTRKLLARGNNNGTENAFGVKGGLFGTGVNGETNRTLASEGKKNQKGIENEKLNCGVENEFDGIPGLGKFSSVNGSAPSLETENATSDVGFSCTFEKFQQYDSFFSKFITDAREFLLPPERKRFGLVSERSLLSPLGVGDSGSWLVMLYLAGCPSCSKILKEGDDLKSILQMHNSLVTELEGDGHDIESALPANKPSILLFVDRSSDSSKTRRKSKEALDAFRELALHNQVPYQVAGQNNDMPEKSSVQAYQASRSTSGHPKLGPSPTIQKVTLKDKTSVMIIKEGRHVTSDDIASDLQDTLPPQTQVQSDQVSPELPMESHVESSVDLDKDQLPYMASISAVEQKEHSKPTDVEPSSKYNEEKATYADTSTQLISVEPDQSCTNHELASAEDVKVEQKCFSPVEKLGEQQLHFQGFRGSFFFSDGGYRLLESLTAGSKIPSMVIIDPISQQHYIFPEETDFSYSSLINFLDVFLNGSLLPYQRSESVLLSPRDAIRPPFVNLDFHEVDSIPRLTSHKFSEMLLDFNQSDNQNAVHTWKKDVLVLFSNSWCGFCQRMELIVREVYRAFKGYAIMLKSGSRNGESVSSSDNLNDVMLTLPLIYLMDCTMNDCSWILKSMGQRELYPSLLLFPAERKNAVYYEGDMAVTDVIKFIVDRGSNSHLLMREKGILWTEAEKGSRNQNLFKDASPTATHEEAPVAKDKYHEILLKNRTPKREVKYNGIRTHTSSGFHGTTSHVVSGSILISTDKLLSVHPFDKSTILVVKVNQSTGFQGLIINKHISWDSLREMVEGLEMLKEAPLSLGGPLIKRGMPLVALVRRVVKDQYPEILPGVYFLDQLATVHEIEGLKLGNQSVTDYWFFLGYSSWGWDQLFDEIAEGAWNIGDDNMRQLHWP